MFSLYSFLTELHRRTNFTKVHRDIKSTESTERYSYCWCWVLIVRCWWLAIGISRWSRPLGGGAAISQVLPLFFFSQNYTEELISQRCTETLSQPIAQNVTAIVGCWVIDVRCWWLAIGVSRWSRPFGGGAAISHVLPLFFSHRTTQKNKFHKGAQRH